MNATQHEVLTAMYDLHPSAFERHVARWLEAEGYRDARVLGGADDRGVDILCVDDDGRRVAVQCKRYALASTVNAITVHHLVGMAVASKAHRAMLVTTGGFTAPARQQAAAFDVELVDGPQLAARVAIHAGLVASLGVSNHSPGAPVVPPTLHPTHERDRGPIPMLDLADVILSDLVRPTRVKVVILLMAVLFVGANWPEHLGYLVFGTLTLLALWFVVKLRARSQ